MALSQSALSELLDAFRSGDGVDMIRESVRTVLQELVEFEAAGASGSQGPRCHHRQQHVYAPSDMPICPTFATGRSVNICPD